jgi:hypothetical protein
MNGSKRVICTVLVSSLLVLACGPIQQVVTIAPTTVPEATQDSDNQQPDPTDDSTPPTQSGEIGTPQEPTVEGDISLHYAAMRAGFESDVDAFAERIRYAVTLDVSTAPLHVEGSERIRMWNTEPEALNDVVLRLYPNALTGDDVLQITSAAVNGQVVEPEFLSAGSAVRLALSEPLEPGSFIDVDVAFTLDIPDGQLVGYGRIATLGAVSVLSSFIPLLSVYEDGEWWTDHPASQGDPAFTDSALFDVALTTSSALTVASSGTMVDSFAVDGNRMFYRIVTGPMRDFSIAVNEEFELAQQTENGVTVSVWSSPGSPEEDQQAIDDTAATLAILDAEFGQYPVAELEGVESPMRGAGGIEYPGLYYTDTEVWDTSQQFYEIVLVHETAHQWWYSVIGNNQVDEPWLDESLAQYSVEVYYRERYGQASANAVRDSYQGTVDGYVQDGQDSMPVGLPVDQYNGQQYSVFVYRKGPLLYSYLADDYGHEAVASLLSAYYSRFKYEIAHTVDLEQIVGDQLGVVAENLFEEWVYGAVVDD